jgi:hypothetical protein
MVDSLLDRRDLTPEEDDCLEVLGDLVERYESEAHPMPPVSDADMLRHLIDAKAVSQTEVSAATGIAGGPKGGRLGRGGSGFSALAVRSPRSGRATKKAAGPVAFPTGTPGLASPLSATEVAPTKTAMSVCSGPTAVGPQRQPRPAGAVPAIRVVRVIAGPVRRVVGV